MFEIFALIWVCDLAFFVCFRYRWAHLSEAIIGSFQCLIRLSGHKLPTGFIPEVATLHTCKRDSQENPIGLPDGSFGFMLKSVVRNPKYRWASQRGKTFWANQPSLLQLGGKQFLAVGRSRQNIVFQMQSNDAGETWSEIKASMLPNPNAGTDAVTLADGRHLLVYNHVPGTPGKWGGVRSPLNIAISNNGQDWKAALGIQTVKSLNRLAINMLA